MIKIPVETNGSSYMTQKVNLNGITLSMRLLWNWVDQHWFADFASANGNLNGVRIIADSLLISASNGVLDEGGLVVLRDDLHSPDALGHDNLGTTFALYYLTDADVTTFRNAGVI